MCVCNETYRSQRALLAHQRKSGKQGHGVFRILHRVSIDNQCLVCQTIFQNSYEAGQHLTRSWFAGRCIANNTHELYEHKPSKPDTCPICHIPVEDIENLAEHLRGHIPTPPSGKQIRIVPKTIHPPRDTTQANKSGVHAQKVRLGPAVDKNVSCRSRSSASGGMEEQTHRVFQRIKREWSERQRSKKESKGEHSGTDSGGGGECGRRGSSKGEGQGQKER